MGEEMLDSLFKVMSIINIYLIWQVIQSLKALSRAKFELKASGQDSQNQSRK